MVSYALSQEIILLKLVALTLLIKWDGEETDLLTLQTSVLRFLVMKRPSWHLSLKLCKKSGLGFYFSIDMKPIQPSLVSFF